MVSQKKINIIDTSIKYIGSISAFTTVTWAFYPDITKIHFLAEYPMSALFLVFILSFILACLKEKNKISISISISKKHNVEIFYKDILNEDGVIIIPVNEYFDTIVDDEIISPNSLHGKFINKYYGNNKNELDLKIDESLRGVISETNKYRVKGKKRKYPLGTICKINSGSNIFYLVALTHFNENNRAYVSYVEYKKVVLDILEYIKEHSQGKKVSIPLIGDGRAALTSFTQEELLDNLCFNIKTTEGLSVEGGLNIILFESENQRIDLKAFELKYIKL